MDAKLDISSRFCIHDTGLDFVCKLHRWIGLCPRFVFLEGAGFPLLLVAVELVATGGSTVRRTKIHY
jgi:hypothetical protein